MPPFSRRRRNSPPSRGIGVGAVLRHRHGPHPSSARCQWPAFALLRCCSSLFRFSRLKPTPAEALAGTVEALAATAALPRAAEASGAPAPSVWRVSAGRAVGLAPLVSLVSAARGVAAAPSAERASAGRTPGAAPSQAAGSPGAPLRALPPPRRAPR